MPPRYASVPAINCVPIGDLDVFVLSTELEVDSALGPIGGPSEKHCGHGLCMKALVLLTHSVRLQATMRAQNRMKPKACPVSAKALALIGNVSRTPIYAG